MCVCGWGSEVRARAARDRRADVDERGAGRRAEEERREEPLLGGLVEVGRRRVAVELRLRRVRREDAHAVAEGARALAPLLPRAPVAAADGQAREPREARHHVPRPPRPAAAAGRQACRGQYQPRPTLPDHHRLSFKQEAHSHLRLSESMHKQP